MLKPEHTKAISEYLTTHEGKKLDYTKPNEVVAKIVSARLLTMTPEQKQQLRALMAQPSASVLKVVLPEFSKAIDMGASGNGATAG